MKKLVFIILIGLVSIKSVAQRVEVLRKSDIVYKKYNPFKGFYMLDSSIDNKGIKYVATIRAKLKKNWFNTNLIACFEFMYYNCKNKAGGLGANSFKLNCFSESDTSKYISLTIDAFFSPDSIIKLNRLKKETNVLYVFPEIEPSPNKTVSFKFDTHDDIKLHCRECFKYNVKIGEIACVSKGGFAGEEKCIEGVANRPATYLAFTGFTYGDGNFRTGLVEYKDQDEGELIVKAYFKKLITLDSNRKAIGY